jgi:hypothetical protein
MSDVIDRPALEQESTAKSRLRIIDCDVHPSLRSRADLNPFLSKRWQEHLKTYGDHLRTPYIGTTPYPRSSPLIARRDAWPPTGGPPGSDLAFMRQQHLDPLDIEFGILQVLDLFIFSQQNLDFGAAIVTGRSTRARRNWACHSAFTSAAMAVTRRPAAAGRPITPRSINRTRIRWRPPSQALSSKACRSVFQNSRSCSSRAGSAGSPRPCGGWTSILSVSGMRFRI